MAVATLRNAIQTLEWSSVSRWWLDALLHFSRLESSISVKSDSSEKSKRLETELTVDRLVAFESPALVCFLGRDCLLIDRNSFFTEVVDWRIGVLRPGVFDTSDCVTVLEALDACFGGLPRFFGVGGILTRS